MKKILFVVAVLFTAACSQNQLSLNISKIDINPLDTQNVFLEDVSKEFVNIDLGAPTDTGLRWITNLFITDSLIIIADKFDQSFFIYGKDGSLKRKIKHLGPNGEEYGNMADALYDEKKNQLEVLDAKFAKVAIYDVNGSFLKQLKFIGGKRGLTFAKARDVYVTPTPTIRNPEIFDRLSTFQVTRNLISYHRPHLTSPPLIKNLSIRFYHQFDTYKDSIYYFPLLDDKIYNVSLDDIKPAYQINMPNANKITEELKIAPKAKDHFAYSEKMEADSVMYNVCGLFVTNNYVSFRYDFKSRRNTRTLFYSKKTGKVKQFTDIKSKTNPDFRSRAAVFAKFGDYFALVSAAAHPLDKQNLSINKGDNRKRPHLRRYTLTLFKLKDF